MLIFFKVLLVSGVYCCCCLFRGFIGWLGGFFLVFGFVFFFIWFFFVVVFSTRTHTLSSAWQEKLPSLNLYLVPAPNVNLIAPNDNLIPFLPRIQKASFLFLLCTEQRAIEATIRAEECGAAVQIRTTLSGHKAVKVNGSPGATCHLCRVILGGQVWIQTSIC